MIVAIHQPNYIPWLGFLNKISKVDVFVIADTVHFTNTGVIHRNKIKTELGWKWLTIPIGNKYRGAQIKDVQLPNDDKWLIHHWNSIKSNYSKCEHFEEFGKFFQDIYIGEKKNSILQELNEAIIFYLFDCFNIHPQIVKSSELDIHTHLRKTDFIIEIVKKVGGDCYISGMGGQKYMDESKFKDEGIELRYSKFEPFEYSQRWNGFEPNMSSIDLLFNHGTQCAKYIHIDY